MGRVVMIVIMAMPVVLPAILCVIMMMMAMGVCVIIRMLILTGTDALHMMMMAHLRQALMGFEPEHLFPVFAELAVHVVVADENAPYPIFECSDDLGVVVQVTSLEKFNIWKIFCYLIRDIINSLD